MSEITPKRPGIVLGAAIMLFISGGFGLLGLFGAASPYLTAMTEAPQPIQGQPNIPDPTRELVRDEPMLIAVMSGLAVFGAFFGAFKIWAGIGVLKLRPSGRSAGIIVGFVSILLTLMENALTAFWYFPKFLRIFLRDMPRELAAVGSIVEAVIWILIAVTVILAIAYWITVILMLNSQRAKNAFAGIPDEPTEGSRERKRERTRGESGDDDEDGYPRSAPPTDTGITDRREI